LHRLSYRIVLRDLSPVSEQALADLHSYRALTAFDVSNSSCLNARGLALIARAPALTKLDLSLCGVNDQAIAHLAKCTSLTELRMNACTTISDRAFPTLAALPALITLDISSCDQESITDTAFVALSRSRTLADLCIADAIKC
jgi:hypothetical protein